MDPELRFYVYNRRFFQILILATLVFVGLISLVWWKTSRQLPPVVVPSGPPPTFSALARETEYISAYADQARYIYDPEAVFSVRKSFFTTPLDLPLTAELIESGLGEVRAAIRASSTTGNLYIQSVSYYVGNLLVLPNETLHNRLATGNYSDTARLIDNALADVRAASIKIQRHFDVAPPMFHDRTIQSQLPYYAPSFPSLSVVEVTTVLSLLARADSERARLYEAQLEVYLSQLLASGSHWPIDIVYGLELANSLVEEMLTMPEYQALLESAKKETVTIQKDVTYEWQPIVFQLLTKPFAYQNNFAVTIESDDRSPVASVEKEIMRGRINLSLQDDRLPDPAPRLYSYSIGQDSILPYGLELTERQFADLGTAVSQARRVDMTGEQFLFLSGRPAPAYEPYRWYSSNRLFQLGADRKPVPLDVEANGYANHTVLDWRIDTRSLVLVDTMKTIPGAGDIWFMDYQNGTITEPKLVGNGQSATLVGQARIFFVREGVVYEWSLDSPSARALLDIPMPDVTTQLRTVRFFSDPSRLLVIDQQRDLESLVPEAQIRRYQLINNGSDLISEPLITVSDAEVHSAMLSPGGGYLAILATLPGLQSPPKLLIINTNDGIVAKDISLSGFDPRRLQLDEWLMQ